MQNSFLWIASLGEADSGWCCKLDVDPGWAVESCLEEVVSAGSAGDRLPRQEVEGRRILEADLVGGPLYGRCDPTSSKRGYLRVAPACRLSRVRW